MSNKTTTDDGELLTLGELSKPSAYGLSGKHSFTEQIQRHGSDPPQTKTDLSDLPLPKLFDKLPPILAEGSPTPLSELMQLPIARSEKLSFAEIEELPLADIQTLLLVDLAELSVVDQQIALLDDLPLPPLVDVPSETEAGGDGTRKPVRQTKTLTDDGEVGDVRVQIDIIKAKATELEAEIARIVEKLGYGRAADFLRKQNALYLKLLPRSVAKKLAPHLEEEDGSATVDQALKRENAHVDLTSDEESELEHLLIALGRILKRRAHDLIITVVAVRELAQLAQAPEKPKANFIPFGKGGPRNTSLLREEQSTIELQPFLPDQPELNTFDPLNTTQLPPVEITSGRREYSPPIIAHTPVSVDMLTTIVPTDRVVEQVIQQNNGGGGSLGPESVSDLAFTPVAGVPVDKIDPATGLTLGPQDIANRQGQETVGLSGHAEQTITPSRDTNQNAIPDGQLKQDTATSLADIIAKSKYASTGEVERLIDAEHSREDGLKDSLSFVGKSPILTKALLDLEQLEERIRVLRETDGVSLSQILVRARKMWEEEVFGASPVPPIPPIPPADGFVGQRPDRENAFYLEDAARRKKEMEEDAFVGHSILGHLGHYILKNLLVGGSDVADAPTFSSGYSPEILRLLDDIQISLQRGEQNDVIDNWLLEEGITDPQQRQDIIRNIHENGLGGGLGERIGYGRHGGDFYGGSNTSGSSGFRGAVDVGVLSGEMSASLQSAFANLPPGGKLNMAAFNAELQAHPELAMKLAMMVMGEVGGKFGPGTSKEQASNQRLELETAVTRFLIRHAARGQSLEQILWSVSENSRLGYYASSTYRERPTAAEFDYFVKNFLTPVMAGDSLTLRTFGTLFTGNASAGVAANAISSGDAVKHTWLNTGELLTLHRVDAGWLEKNWNSVFLPDTGTTATSAARSTTGPDKTTTGGTVAEAPKVAKAGEAPPASSKPREVAFTP